MGKFILKWILGECRHVCLWCRFKKECEEERWWEEMIPCDMCREWGECDCKFCSIGNPCLDCDDYDAENDECKSHGGCAGENE